MKIFNIRDYGAKICDSLQTDNIQKAIDDCFLAGGGRVVIPCGVYVTGGLRIRSGVELYLETGAILKGSRNAEDYFGYLEDKVEPVTPEEIGKKSPSAVCTSRWCNGLIRAIDAHDFAIIGEPGSYIDGCNSYDPKGEHNYRGVHGFSIWRCKNIRLEGYTFLNSGNWCHALFQSQNITIRNVAIHGGEDGIDIRTCDDVLIENCDINSPDDAVAGFDNNNVIVRNCKLNSSFMSLRIGGNNFLVENCISNERNFGSRARLTYEEKLMGAQHNPEARHEQLAVFAYYCDFRAMLRKAPEKIVIRNCRFEQVKEPIRLEFTGLNRWCVQRALKEVTFENCYMGDLCQTGMLWGDPEDKVICRFKNVTFACREDAQDVPLLAVGNVEKLLFENCTFEGYSNPNILVGTDDLENIEIVGSGKIEVKKASFEDCLLAHPSGIAWKDWGKLLFWDLKDPNAPPVPGPDSLREKLAAVQRS